MKKPNALVQALLLLVIGSALGLASNALRPHRAGKIPWVGQWDQFVESKALEEGIFLVLLPEVKSYQASGSHIFLDARPVAEYQAGHIPGALSLPFEEKDEKIAEVEFLLQGPVITYCSGAACDDSLELTKYLRAVGFTNIALYAGGFNEWKAAGLPVEGAP